MVPSAFVFLDAFPLTPNGKLNRKALPEPGERLAQTAPANDLAETLMTSAERRVADIWRKVLRLDRVGLRDNFFELGGHSLLLLKLYGQLQKEFSIDFAVVKLFQHTTISGQAELLAPVANSGNTTQSSGDHVVKRAQERAGKRKNG
jgi:acyl carrier protein